MILKNISLGRKERVVIDIKNLNVITKNNNYPLSLQADIITLITKYVYISIVNDII